MIKYLRLLVLPLISCVVSSQIVATQQQLCGLQQNGLRTYNDLLNEMPKQDYQALNELFQYLIFDSYFAYTLFGDKPITHKGAFLYNPTKITPNSDYPFLANWKIWKKYSSSPEFQAPNYAFVEKKFPEMFEIHFINKKNVIQCINQNLDIFKEILGNNITADKVLNDMLTYDDIYDALGKSQILYGILFGFGRTNAIGYHQKFELELPLKDPKPFHTEKQGYLNPLPLPYFSVFDEGAETQQLRKKYSLERDKILDIYSKGDFLEITFQQLTKIN